MALHFITCTLQAITSNYIACNCNITAWTCDVTVTLVYNMPCNSWRMWRNTVAAMTTPTPLALCRLLRFRSCAAALAAVTIAGDCDGYAGGDCIRSVAAIADSTQYATPAAQSSTASSSSCASVPSLSRPAASAQSSISTSGLPRLHNLPLQQPWPVIHPSSTPSHPSLTPREWSPLFWLHAQVASQDGCRFTWLNTLSTK